MKQVYTNESHFLVNNAKNLIEAEGIDTFIKNEFSQGAMGELPFHDTWPQLWVYNDKDLDNALAIIETSQNVIKKADWICKNCSEENPSSFELCWNCQSESIKKD